MWPALKGRAAVCAGGRRPAREIATREPAARSGRSRGPPWPCRRPPAPRPGPPVPPAPSTPAAPCCCVWLGALARSPAGPRRRPPAPRPGPPVPPAPSGTAAWPSGPSAALRHRGLALQSLRRPPYQWGWLGALACCLARSCCLLSASRGGSRVEFLGCLGACCYERRQSEVFLVWISDPLLQTSSIRGLFR